MAKSVLIIFVGLLMTGSGTYDLLRLRAQSRDGDMAMLNRWGSIVIAILGLIIFISGLIHTFNCLGGT